MFTLVIYNPVAGDCTAEQFFQDHVFPLLEQNIKSPMRRLATEHAGHAGTFIKDVVDSDPDVGQICVVLGSGDGTLHEIVNSTASLNGGRRVKVSIALIPCGTANALYSSLFPVISDKPSPNYRLQSFKSYLSDSTRKPITLAITKPSTGNPDQQVPPLVSAVVVSTALHASILHDSESLRKTMPGIERFKVAAQQNSTRWYHGQVVFKPIPGRVVQIYDPSTKSFHEMPASASDGGRVKLDGPFAYFLATVNVDRLEPTFRITPLAITLPPTEPCMDVVVIRPLRDPGIKSDTEAERTTFVPKLWAVLGGAYRDGEHVHIRYDEKGQPSADHTGEGVVEYIRCGGWEWVPDEADEKAHMICTDGYISHLKGGGRAECTIGRADDNSQFTIYV